MSVNVQEFVCMMKLKLQLNTITIKSQKVGAFMTFQK